MSRDSREAERIGPYEVAQEIATGGMGVVYRARDPVLHREVALKVLKSRDATRDTYLARFLREGRVSAHLRHPNLLAPLAVGQDGDRFYLAFPLVEGERLDEFVESRKPDLRERVRLIREVAAALDYIHGQSLVHRDVKPANVLVDREGRVRLIDFGLVRSRDVEEESLTDSGQVVGTPRYMSPEQARGDASAIAAASDLFSLGALAYEVWTGRFAFDGATRDELLQRIERADPAPPSSVFQGFPPALEAIVMRLLAKRPRDRFRSARDVVRALDRYLAGRTVGAFETRARHRTGLAVAAGFLLVAIVAAAVALVVRDSKSDGAGSKRDHESRPDRSEPRRVPDRDPAQNDLPAVADPMREFALAVDVRPRGARAALQRIDRETLRRDGRPEDLGRPPVARVVDVGDSRGALFLLLVSRGPTDLARSISIPFEVAADREGYPPVSIALDLDELAAGEVLVPEGPSGTIAVDRAETTAGAWSAWAREWGFPEPVTPVADPDRPVRGVSEYEAWLYALLAGRRLLSSDEWDLVAFGPWDAEFPHGNGLAPLEPVKLDYLATGFHPSGADDPFGTVLEERARPPGSRTVDVSVYGAQDVAFNVQEWTSSCARDDPSKGVYRGFDFWALAGQLEEPDVRLAVSHPPWLAALSTGVRTARSLEEANLDAAGLERLLGDADPESRARGLRGLFAAAASGETALRWAETRGLVDREARVRYLSLVLLAKAGRSAGDAALDLLADTDPAVRERAEALLAATPLDAETLAELATRAERGPPFEVGAARGLAAWLDRPEVADLVAAAPARETLRAEILIEAFLAGDRPPRRVPDPARAVRLLQERAGGGSQTAALAVEFARAAASREDLAPGVIGRYYTGPGLDRPVLARVDAAPSHHWDTDPVLGLPPDDIGVRWFGLLEIDEPGAYTFEAYADDGVRIAIDGKTIVDYWGHGFRTWHASRPVELAKGLHPIVVETIDFWGAAILALRWSHGGRPMEPVPQARFHHPRQLLEFLQVR